ncbi:MAG: type II toxin-antitoxin system PemK/MazF family toxin [Candidatus Pacearchaeota archaeon]
MKRIKYGKMPKSGDVVLANVQFTDTFEVKRRPALVLFEEYDNIIVAGITSNVKMEGVKLLRKDGAIKDSVIKLNYIFTISKEMVSKVIFCLKSDKKREIYEKLAEKLSELKN